MIPGISIFTIHYKQNFCYPIIFLKFLNRRFTQPFQKVVVMQAKILIADAETILLHCNLALQKLIGDMLDLIKGDIFDEWLMHGLYWMNALIILHV